jgi:hypothetical protein
MAESSAIADAMRALRSANDIARDMIDAPDAEAFRVKQIKFLAKLMEVNQYAFAAQDERGELLREISALEEKVASFEAWSAEQRRYELKDVGAGSLAYVIKEAECGAEPLHHLCARCFQHREKSILQPRQTQTENRLFCPECKTEIKIADLPWNASFT